MNGAHAAEKSALEVELSKKDERIEKLKQELENSSHLLVPFFVALVQKKNTIGC